MRHVKMPNEIHHIGYIVPDIELAAKQLQKALSFHLIGHVVYDPSQDARIVLGRIPLGLYIELVQPSSEASRIYNYLKKNGAGKML
jgi:hypothetical protein